MIFVEVSQKWQFRSSIAVILDSYINVFLTQHAEQHQKIFGLFIFYGYFCRN